MNKKLRSYLQRLGLAASATERTAWRFFHQLSGRRRSNADAYRRGLAPSGTSRGTGDNASVRTERQRVSSIRRLAGSDVPQRLVTRAIDQGWTVGRASSEFLEYVRSRRGTPARRAPAGHSRSHERDCTARALAAGLMHRTGTEVIDREFNQQRSGRLTERDADMGDRYRTWSMVDICREALRLDGRSVPHDREEMIRAAVSTQSLSNIFSTSIHARLLASYEESLDTTDWCAEEEVINFQQQERASLGKTGAMEKLPRGGEAKHATLSDSVETYKIARYAKQFVVDEQDLLDDNLTGLQHMPDEMGNSAARLRPDLVYSILLANASLNADGVALFHATHANTATTAFDKAGLQAIVTKMMKQTQDNVRLNLRPTHLIVPGDLEFDARDLLFSTTLITGENLTRGDKNSIADLNLQLRVEGRVDANGVTDPESGTAYTGSATNWFLVSAMPRAMVVGYLAGTGRRPQMRRFVLDKGRWGIGWDVKMDIGAKALDYRPFQRGNT